MTKFEELRDKRLPVALSKIKLLGNLGRPSYGASRGEKTAIVTALEGATAALRAAYKLNPPEPKREPLGRPTGIPAGLADDGATFEAEVRWAIDAIRRGDYGLAESRLRRCLTAERD